MTVTPESLEAKVPPAACEVSSYHSPVPLRYVWHHIQPEAAGGATEVNNLAGLCDSCHYSIHRLMWNLAHGITNPKVPRKQLTIATDGYNRCVAAGTVDKIPNEG